MQGMVRLEFDHSLSAVELASDVNSFDMSTEGFEAKRSFAFLLYWDLHLTGSAFTYTIGLIQRS
jgi:hypothetical protein